MMSTEWVRYLKECHLRPASRSVFESPEFMEGMTLNQTIQQIKEALEASSNPTINGVNVPALCNALEIAVKALEEIGWSKLSREPMTQSQDQRVAKSTLAQIEAALAKPPPV